MSSEITKILIIVGCILKSQAYLSRKWIIRIKQNQCIKFTGSQIDIMLVTLYSAGHREYLPLIVETTPWEGRLKPYLAKGVSENLVCPHEGIVAHALTYLHNWISKLHIVISTYPNVTRHVLRCGVYFIEVRGSWHVHVEAESITHINQKIS